MGKQESKKYDSGKPDLTLLPIEGLSLAAQALMFGATKYGRHNYKETGFALERILAAALRHIYAFESGETLDPESGVSHLGHALASLLMAAYIHQNFPEKDNRHKKS